jgi:squalene-hopene/tetraprenyl-beta-curcumene cyclase
LAAHLVSRQFNEDDGWGESNAAFGAWGMGGDKRLPPHAGHVDLSMTRHVLEALAAFGVGPDAPAMRRARVFLERLQNDDGGFHFSTVVDEANKAGGTRSYGTATADGVLALLAAGAEPRRVADASAWLVRHHRPDLAPGLVGEAYRRWPQGLRYYYAAASVRAMGRVDQEQSRLLRSERRGDGSWSNPEPLVKEDDPLIATGFALRAIGA